MTSDVNPVWQKPSPMSLAPMMDYTDRHFRYLLRIISKSLVLYTEMITAKAIIYGKADRLLAFSDQEHPVVCQIGGSEPDELAKAAQMIASFGYDEINLNIGCPSPRVQSGAFGACLMREPKLVAACVAAMREAVTIPVTVKTRLGIDDQDDYAFLQTFIEAMQHVGVHHLILHARKAWLKGLSPKQNREIPPLIYERVYQAKQDYPDLMITINGGIQTLAEVEAHLAHVDAVMLGRILCQHPMLVAPLDALIARARGDAIVPQVLSVPAVVAAYLPYMQAQLQDGWRVTTLIKPLIGLCHGQSGAKRWRQMLSCDAIKSADPVALIAEQTRVICGA